MAESSGLPHRGNEDKLPAMQSTSPTQKSRSGFFDFATNGRTLERSTTDPVTPKSPEKHVTLPSPRAATQYEPAKQSTTDPKKTFFGNITKPLRRILPVKENNVAEGAPNGHAVRRNSTHNTKYSASFEDTEVWDRKAILSLDGGGIRGYSALLIIKELMKVIGELERAESNDPATSSYHPVPSAQVAATDDEAERTSHTPETPPTDTSPWLPCHYFDYMAGTSTGGLIGIMLGRLRMSIDDCIADYEKLGAEVFAHSRWFHLRSPLWFPREKYNHEVLEQVVQDVVERRVPKIGGFPGGKTFAFDENRCRVVVVAFQQQENGKTEKPYLFRTYKNLHRGSDEQDRKTDRNPGPAHDLPIWQVARATSAAPTYFEEVDIEGLKYLDGGFGANNPCVEIFREVRRMNNYNEKCIKIIVSIGTGMSDKTRIKDSNKKKKGGKRARVRASWRKFLDYENFARKWATDSETAHVDMLNQYRQPKKPFEYYRFNVKTGLGSMKLDEWRERSHHRIRMGKLVARVRPENSQATTNGAGANEASNETVTNGKPNGSSNTNSDNAPLNSDPQDPGTQLHSIPHWCRPKNKTLEAIRQETEKYLEDEIVRGWINKCARELVDGRRGRARRDPDRWERACYSAWFQCNVDECPRGEKEYPDSHAMEKHLLDKHGIIYNDNDEESRKLLKGAVDRCKIIVH